MNAAITIIASLVLGLLLGRTLQKPEVRAALTNLPVQMGVWFSYAMVRILPGLAGFLAKNILLAFEQTQPTMIAVITSLMREVTGAEIPVEQAIRLGRAGSLIEFGRTLSRGPGRAIFDAVTPPESLTPTGAKRYLEELVGISASFALDDWWDRTILELTSLGQLSHAADLSNAIAQGFGIASLGRRGMSTLMRRSIAPYVEEYANRTYRGERLSKGEIIDAWQQGLLSDTAALDALASEGYTHERALLLLNIAQRDFSLTEIEQLYRLGRIDRATLERMVRRQGYGEARAELAIELIDGKRTLTLLEELADRARAQYRAGVLGAAEYDELLRRAGYRQAERELARAADDLRTIEERALTKGEILEGYREGVLDEPDARRLLRELRYPEEAVDVLLATQRKTLTPAQLIDALIRGVLPETEVRRRLEAAGYDPRDVDVLLDLRTRRLTAGQVIDALTRQLIGPDAARRLLIQQGFAEEMIDLLLAFQRRQLSPGDIQAALVRGLISEGEALARFRALGYTEEDARLLLALRFSLLSTGQILDTYAAGMLTRRSALTRLGQLGWSAEDAELLLVTFEAKMAREGRPRPPAS